MATRDQQGAGNQGHCEPLLGRRALIVRGSGAALGALLAVRVGGSGVSKAAAHRTLRLGSYGAAGDGRRDDTAAIQRAVNAAPPGSTVLGAHGRVYLLSGTIYFTNDDMALDLGGATVQTAAQRTEAAATGDTMFAIGHRRGVRITNGRIAAPLSRYRGRDQGAKIVIDHSSGCTVDHLKADCAGSNLISISGGGGHRIEHNSINRGSIGGLGCSNVLIRRNVINDSPYNALGIAGYKGTPAVGNQYIENVIRRYGRVGIEDTSPEGAENNSGTVIRGNRIEAPARNATSGTAISAIGTAAVIARNEIHDATGWAIEADGQGTRIMNNRISWRSPSNPAVRPPAIIINSSTPGAPRSVVSGNRVVNAYVGISVYAGPYLGPVLVQGNVIKNPIFTGIALGVQGGTFAGATCSGNVVEFSVPPAAGVRTRTGIQTTTGMTLTSNRVAYGKRTYSRRTVDVPIEFDGDHVVARHNVVASSRRTQGNLVCRSQRGTWSGWTLTDNRFLDGTFADLSSLIRPVLSGNIGRLIL